MTLLDELRVSPPSRRHCSVCNFLAAQPNAEEWREAMKDLTITVPTLLRAMTKRGYRFGDGPLYVHRSTHGAR